MAALSGLPWHQILFAAYAVWVVGACVTILLARRSPAATLAWIFAFVALPVVSGLYYLVFGPRRLARRRRRYAFARGTLANFRTHRKIVVCDGTTGFLGGMNLHDPESATHSGKEAWRDAHGRGAGEPVRRLQRLFFEGWAFAGGALSITPESVRLYFPAAAAVLGPPVQVLASGPADETAPIHAFFLAALSTARRRVWIETPYLVPDEPLESALVVAHLRGVDVPVVVPKEGDSRLVTAASRTYCQSLRRAGIAVYEYGPPMLHAKTMLVDASVAVVGTANLDNRSFRLNFEAAVVLYDPAALRELAGRFEADRAAAGRFPTRRRGPRLTALTESLARLTSPVL